MMLEIVGEILLHYELLLMVEVEADDMKPQVVIDEADDDEDDIQVLVEDYDVVDNEIIDEIDVDEIFKVDDDDELVVLDVIEQIIVDEFDEIEYKVI